MAYSIKARKKYFFAANEAKTVRQLRYGAQCMGNDALCRVKSKCVFGAPDDIPFSADMSHFYHQQSNTCLMKSFHFTYLFTIVVPTSRSIDDSQLQLANYKGISPTIFFFEKF